MPFGNATFDMNAFIVPIMSDKDKKKYFGVYVNELAFIKMKTKYQLIIPILIFFCSNGFSQKDSLTIVNKTEVRNYHKKIFQLSVDTTIDSTSVYTLRYSYRKGWTMGPNNPNHNKKYKSKNFSEYLGCRKVPMTRILTSPMPYKDSTYLPLNARIASSRKDVIYKILKKRKFDDSGLTGIISLGGKYLLVARKTTYIGNTSWSGIEYLYYEKEE